MDLPPLPGWVLLCALCSYSSHLCSSRTTSWLCSHLLFSTGSRSSLLHSSLCIHSPVPAIDLGPFFNNAMSALPLWTHWLMTFWETCKQQVHGEVAVNREGLSLPFLPDTHPELWDQIAIYFAVHPCLLISYSMTCFLNYLLHYIWIYSSLSPHVQPHFSLFCHQFWILSRLIYLSSFAGWFNT